MSAAPTLGDILAMALSAMPEPEPEPLILRASYGDLDALREMAANARGTIDGVGVSAPLAYMEAITLQRLVAAQGDPDDVRALVVLLSSFASFWRGQGHPDLDTYFEAQALNHAESLAEDGDDEVADIVVAAADDLPAAVHIMARQLRAEQEGNR